MNPIIIDGEEFKLVPILSKGVSEEIYALEPVKKTEEKEPFRLELNKSGNGFINYLIRSEELELTETTANKLSEAISALVKYMEEDYPVYKNREILMKKINEARQSFQESQND